MLLYFLIFLFCPSLLVTAFPQVTQYHNSSVVAETSEPQTKSTSSLETTKSALQTGVSTSCPSCSFDGPLITGYQWVPVVANQTITATVILLVAPVTANASGPYKVNQASYTIVDTQTLYNSLPPEVTIPLVGVDGSAIQSVFVTGTDGQPSETFVTYPTNVLDYQSSFDWTGTLPTSSSGGSSCVSGGATHSETLPSHPTYAVATPLPTNVAGTNYELVQVQYADVAFLESAFPDEAPFSQCSGPVVAANQTAVTRPFWVTVTSYANATSGSYILSAAPMTEHTVPSNSDDSGLGNFTPLPHIAHTEFTVPLSNEQSTATAMPEGSGGGRGGGQGESGGAGGSGGLPGAIASVVGSDGLQGSGSSGSSGSQGGSLPGEIASIVGQNHPSPGGSPGSSGPQATSGAGSSGGSGQSGSSGGSSPGSSSSGGSSSGGQGSSGSGSSGIGSSGGGSSGSSSGSSGGSSGDSSGGSSSGTSGGIGSSSGGSSGSGSSGPGSSGSGSSGSGASGSGASGASGSSSNGGQSGNAPAPGQSITVGSTVLPVTHTTLHVTSNVAGHPVTSTFPAVIIGGSTATQGQTLTFDNTPVAFTATSTPGSSSSSNSGSGSGNNGASSSGSAGLSSGSSGSGSGSSGSGSENGALSGSGSSSGSSAGNGGLGSGGALIIGGTSTVSLLPIATGSSSGSSEPAPVTIGNQPVAPTILPSGSGIGFVVSGQTLAPNHPITIGSGSSTTVVSLTTNSQGETLLVQGTSTQTLQSGLPPITVGSQIVEPTALSSGGEGFVVSGQTLAPGHPITLGSGSHTTVLSLATDSLGDTVLVEGTSTITLAEPTSTSIGGHITNGLSGTSGNNANSTELSNGAGRSKGKVSFGLGVCVAVVLGTLGTIVMI